MTDAAVRSRDGDETVPRPRTATTPVVPGRHPAASGSQTTPVTAAAPPGSPPRGTRLAVLDGLRLLAALAVVAKHWIGVGAAPLTGDGKIVYPWGTGDMVGLFGPAHGPASYGWLGVNLFFLISGFVICMSAWGRGLGAFFTSRVARLFPAYWFAVALTVAVMLLSDLTGGDVRKGITNALLNVTMVQKGYGGYDLDPSYWTLWYELRFYLLFAIVVALGTTYRRVVAFCALWTVAAMISAASGERLVDLAAMNRYAPYFIAGVAFSVMYRHGRTMLLWGIIGFNYVLALAFVKPQAARQMQGSGVDPDLVTLWIVVTVCFGALALVALRVCDRVQWRWLTVAGALTYPLYLMHQTVGFIAIDALRGHLPPVAVLAVTLVGMLVLSWLVWRLVERPMSRWLRNGLRASFDSIRRAEAPADPAPGIPR